MENDPSKLKKKNEQQSELRKTLVSAAVWVGSGFASIILMTVLMGRNSIFTIMFHFMLPNLVIMFTAGLYDVGTLFSDIINLFKRRERPKYFNENGEPTKKYGRMAIPISLILYGLIGFIISVFWRDVFTRIMIVHLSVGLIWGYVVYYFYQKKYFTRDNFY